jgi:hypothetical protein
LQDQYTIISATGQIFTVLLMIALTLVFASAFVLGASLQNLDNQAKVASDATPWDPQAEMLRYQTNRLMMDPKTLRISASSELSNQFLIVDPPELLHYGKEVTDIDDLFSASWIMNLSLVMRVNLDDVKTVEDGCFGPFRQANQWGFPVGQTRDWFDLSVEHLSHYWRAANVCYDRSAYKTFLAHMNNYISNVKMVESSPLRDTIGILAFQPYSCSCSVGTGEAPCTGQELTKTVLTATLKSLQRAGLGRVVVVSTVDTDDYEPRDVTFGDTQVVFIKVDPATTQTVFIHNNLPHGAIANLQEAVRNKDVKWLGEDTGRWRSVLLTEPDMIMHVKENSIHNLAQAVHTGFTIAPHRLQPVPHPSDAPAVRNSISEGSRAFEVVSVGNEDATCVHVDGAGRPPSGEWLASHPGRVDMCRENPRMVGCCNVWWWQCGFRNGNHTRLEHYTMMRLGYGSGVTVLSADEQGRKCLLHE